jgi:hypothetical protein
MKNEKIKEEIGNKESILFSDNNNNPNLLDNLIKTSKSNF